MLASKLFATLCAAGAVLAITLLNGWSVQIQRRLDNGNANPSTDSPWIMSHVQMVLYLILYQFNSINTQAPAPPKFYLCNQDKEKIHSVFNIYPIWFSMQKLQKIQSARRIIWRHPQEHWQTGLAWDAMPSTWVALLTVSGDEWAIAREESAPPLVTGTLMVAGMVVALQHMIRLVDWVLILRFLW